ncbi:putative aminoadipate-semialdehyde dehydrogenase [Poronia punctata]|nr:putative aminoadipate-semialdehyde dehydrogenase [Poronia punctata]
MASPVVISKDDVDEEIISEVSRVCEIPADMIEDTYSCTPLQIATIVESALHTGTSVFQFVFTLAPPIDHDRFCLALQDVVSRNSILRTRFVDTRHGFLQVVVHETHCTERTRGEVAQYLEVDKSRHMSLGMSLFRTAIVDCKLVVTVHHGVMDHASLTPLFEDILIAYHGAQPRDRAPFKDFATRVLQIEDDAAKAFWEPRFKGAPAIFPKPETGHVPLATQVVTERIDMKKVNSEFSPVHIPSYIETAWAMTCSTYTSSESVAFGLVLSGRTPATAAETTLGPTIAVLPVQVNIKDTAMLETLLKESATARRQLQTHAALQYGLNKIRTLSEAARVASGFQTLLNIRPRWYDPKEDSDVTFDYMNEPHEAFSLVLSCDLEDGAVLVRAVYDPKVLCTEQMTRVLHQFKHFLQTLAEVPRQTKLGQIPRLGPHDREEILRWNSETNHSVPTNKCLHELFSDKAKERRTAIAVDAHDGRTTYGELDQMSDDVARHLRQEGVDKGSPVAFIFEKSMWTIVAILGILKAGGACIPIAIIDPIARKQEYITRSGVKTVLTSKLEYESSIHLAPNVIEISAESILELKVDRDPGLVWTVSPHSLAYILFTSGSTGLPKGVLLEHYNLSSSLQRLLLTFGWVPGTRMMQFASHIWDLSIGEIFSALLSGGCLFIPSEETRQSDLANYIASNNINCVFLTPTVLRALSPNDIPNVHCLISAGEAISPEWARTWGRGRRFFNGWGPCEASILSSVAELAPDSPYPDSIGFPVNCSIWVVNPRNVNELVPIGSVGEILISGPGVAQGYLKDDAKTRMSFVKPPSWFPASGRHLYRTGDLAKYNPDGSISFVGRKDSQVKIRGQRLELGEVEVSIAGSEHVRDIIVTTKISEGRTELVAILCLANPSLPRNAILQELPSESSIGELRIVRDYARDRLPIYMVPTVWIPVEELPRTASAKLDRMAISQWLKTKNISAARAAIDGVQDKVLTCPSTEHEMLLRSIWSSVLGIPDTQIGRETIFSQVGGDSILAMQVVGQARKEGFRISASVLLKNLSLATIAEASSKVEPAEEGTQTLPKNMPLNTTYSEQKAAISSTLGHTNPRLASDDVEAVVPATHGQATMLVAGETGGRGYYIDFDLGFDPPLDKTRLHNSCSSVIRSHSILRTVFVYHETEFYQVVLKTQYPDMVIDREGDYVPTLFFQQGYPLACFNLMSDRHGNCQRLVLEIHHALYDAVSLGLIFQDLDAAYAGRPLSNGPDYHAWVSHTKALDSADPIEFWRDVLQGSSMPSLVSLVPGRTRGHPLTSQVNMQIPLQSIKTTLGTPSTVLKAAWSLLLSFALNKSDVIFGEVSANRFLPFTDIELVKGPCVNMVPVRAHIGPSKTLSSMIEEIQNLFITGLPHHHLETDKILTECHPPPTPPRFSTAIVYQNHSSLAQSVQIGPSTAKLTSRGVLGDTTDIHVIATPHSTTSTLDIEIRYSPQTIPSEQMQWIAKALRTIMDSISSSLEKGNTMAEIEAHFRRVMGAYVVPPPPCPSPSSRSSESLASLVTSPSSTSSTVLVREENPKQEGDLEIETPTT